MTKTQLRDRALEPISDLFMLELMVPYIYFDVNWPDPKGQRVDVLAIDRAGRGDPHIIEVKVRLDAVREVIEQLQRIPASYKWLAYYSDKVSEQVLRSLRRPKVLFPEKGAGRIGLIEVFRTPEDELRAEVIIRAERFPGVYHDEVDAFTEAHEPVFRY